MERGRALIEKKYEDNRPGLKKEETEEIKALEDHWAAERYEAFAEKLLEEGERRYKALEEKFDKKCAEELVNLAEEHAKEIKVFTEEYKELEEELEKRVQAAGLSLHGLSLED